MVTNEINSPLYDQVKKWVVRKINEGEFSEGSQIPSEPSLASTLNISRGTVRKALKELVAEGYLMRLQGKGTFVKKKEDTEWPADTLVSLAKAFDKQNVNYTTKVIDIKVVQAPMEISSRLNIEPTSKVIQLDRVRSVSKEPVHLSTSYLPYKLGLPLLDISLENKSLYRVMSDKLGVDIQRVERVIYSKLADPWETKFLQLPEISAILVLLGTAFSSIGLPVETSIARFSSDRSRFSIESKKISIMDT